MFVAGQGESVAVLLQASFAEVDGSCVVRAANAQARHICAKFKHAVGRDAKYQHYPVLTAAFWNLAHANLDALRSGGIHFSKRLRASPRTRFGPRLAVIWRNLASVPQFLHFLTE